jgi:putative Ca2+/H+ antiporter (TMEM165/GDT1 family)
MLSFVATFAVAFGAILLVELPDKTLVATLVLSTKYRHRPVLVGVGTAFAVQCVVAVTAGGLLRLLPHRAVEAIVALLFAVGALVLWRESVDTADSEEASADVSDSAALSSRRIFGISFGVLFAAEWGDASQLATAALVARYGEPIAIGLAAFGALVAVAALAVAMGKVVLRKVPLAVIHRLAATLFTWFAVIAGVAAVRR